MADYFTLLNSDNEILWQDPQAPPYALQSVDWQQNGNRELRQAFRAAAIDDRVSSAKVYHDNKLEYEVTYEPITRSEIVIMATTRIVGARRFQLSPRQTQVLTMISRGLTQKEIASELGVSVFTIISHSKMMRSKLGISNRATLVRLAMDHGLT